MATNAVLEERIDNLLKLHKDNEEKIEKLEERLNHYDKVAAKWGGILMFATACGGFLMTYWEKVVAWAAPARVLK